MLDILARAGELLLTLVTQHREKKDHKTKRRFGVLVISCYLRLLEVIETADDIQRELEYFDRRFKEHLDFQDNWTYWRSSISEILGRQCVNLRRFEYALRRIRREMRVLAPDLARELEDLVEPKMSILSQLWALLSDEKLPLETHLEEFPDAIRHMIGRPKLAARTVNVADEWGIEVYDNVHSYLKNEEPRHALESMKRGAEALREELLRHFGLEDVLWAVKEFRTKH